MRYSTCIFAAIFHLQSIFCGAFFHLPISYRIDSLIERAGMSHKKRKSPPRTIEGLLKNFKKSGSSNLGHTNSGDFDPDLLGVQEKQHRYRFNVRPENHIWVDGELIRRPNNLSVSYGILLYKKEDAKFKYLLGLIPQGNAWTVFKGMPEEGETPEQTATREFKEETSIAFPFPDFSDCVETTLFGRTSKKLLEIFLIAAPENFDFSQFDIEQVVKIDAGYMQGKPEIIDIQFLTKQQAVEGTKAKGGKVAKVYKSQVGILEHAEEVLKGKEKVNASDSE